ncbi:MAG: glycine-rich protein, partial [Myxococcota bacterium]|nr:glycine-rich protein [Myxococcota bacterium]
ATDSGTGSLIDPSAIGLDETWICSVTPYDNDEYGTTLQSSSLIVPQWTGIREFSTCGQTGSEGPSQSDCDSLYSGSTLESEIVVDNGIQKWVAPRSGIYSIEVMGAAGGNSNSGIGGAGSYMSGEFRIDVGTELYVIVGQEGDNAGSTGGAGGGGGTFVLEADGTPLIIAGGGGGAASYQSYIVDGLDAPLTESGANGNSDDHLMGGIGGSNGLGGGGSIGSGGAGLLGDGGGSFPGLSYANGLLGGSAATFGGFGGGAGSDPSHGPGGGGGYSGGGAGEFIHYYGSAGGGGSYNSGQNQNNQSGVGEQEGRVFINFIE